MLKSPMSYSTQKQTCQIWQHEKHDFDNVKKALIFQILNSWKLKSPDFYYSL
jgi:hypothetical protein